MLENTFCHIHGLGLKTEQVLWEHGVLSWRDIRETHPLPLPPDKQRLLRAGIQESTQRMQLRDVKYFCDALPADQHWRLYPLLCKEMAYLDIETTGMNWETDHITTICVYKSGKLKSYVHGQNLDDFVADLPELGVLVTYSGKRFDIPFIEKKMRISLFNPHIDLHQILGNLGYRGGLKGIEKRMGINRESMTGVDGKVAILLWMEYERNANEAALQTLLAYNALDVVNLEAMMIGAYNEGLARTPFHSRAIDPPKPVRLDDLPFEVDYDLLSRFRS